MPLYEYQCQDCGKALEVIQKFSEDPLTECPQCGGRLERLLSAPAIQFKGSGWYITDYARKSGNGESKQASSTEKKEDVKSAAPDKGGSSDKSGSSESKTTDSGGAAKSGEAPK